jgi:hypothetical protein
MNDTRPSEAGDLDAEEVSRMRAQLEADMAFIREHMEGPIATWPAEVRQEYAVMAESWQWLQLFSEDGTEPT